MTVLSSSYALALISSSQGIISDASVSYRLIVGALSAAVVFCAQRGASKYQRIASMHCREQHAIRVRTSLTALAALLSKVSSVVGLAISS